MKFALPQWRNLKRKRHTTFTHETFSTPCNVYFYSTRFFIKFLLTYPHVETPRHSNNKASKCLYNFICMFRYTPPHRHTQFNNCRELKTLFYLENALCYVNHKRIWFLNLNDGSVNKLCDRVNAVYITKAYLTMQINGVWDYVSVLSPIKRNICASIWNVFSCFWYVKERRWHRLLSTLHNPVV